MSMGLRMTLETALLAFEMGRMLETTPSFSGMGMEMTLKTAPWVSSIDTRIEGHLIDMWHEHGFKNHAVNFLQEHSIGSHPINFQ